MPSITKRPIFHPNNEEEIELRRGPWTLEEDTLLIHYIACHGEGHWNLLAKRAGLKRTGKSCRLRWLNYLKPDIKRGNLTPQEQLLILELHSKWGNRWSKIAQQLPGRTDNEIKNYWRTRVQKQARQLNIDSNSKKFIEAVHCFWKPRLLQKMEQSSSSSSSPCLKITPITQTCSDFNSLPPNNSTTIPQAFSASASSNHNPNYGCLDSMISHLPQISEQVISNSTVPSYGKSAYNESAYHVESYTSFGMEGINLDPISEIGGFDISEFDSHMAATDWMLNVDMADALWNMEQM
ncbi:hypothetical protein UlMin_040542 [Ulmus minor]